MRLIGMLDSPYVRRVAVSLAFLDVPFSHESVSVFRHFDEFKRINPVVKAPTVVTDDGVVLMDSSLILEYVAQLVPAERRLLPSDTREHARAQRIIGLALAACEKTVQIIYERNLRPAEKQHAPWIDRVRGQMLAAYDLLAAEIGTGDQWLFGERPLQPDISVAVAWRFSRELLADVVPVQKHPALARLSARAEALPEFKAWPFDG
jgi:glutathione S-transferase